MHWSAPLKKQWLEEFHNPLTLRLGRDFFLSLPQKPGVYFFFGRHAGEDDALLYVGKAKNLRHRLASYRRATPETVSRKVLWMIQQTQRIEVKPCRSERAALLKENALLRRLRPPFNVLNTSPEEYLFITQTHSSSGMQFRITATPPEFGEPGEKFYGAFKSRASVRDAYGAFLRLLWMSTSKPDPRYKIPGTLLRYRPPSPYLVCGELPQGWEAAIFSYFSGRSRRFLTELTRSLLENEAIPPLFYGRIQEDLSTLQDFFRSHCARNRRLCLHFGRKGALIAQDEIDDWNVAWAFRNPTTA